MTEGLCVYQERAVDALVSRFGSGYTTSLETLLVGAPGTGKRTIAQRAADRSGLLFVEIRLDQPRRDVAVSLFGSDTEQAEEEGYLSTGGLDDLGHAGPILVYMSHLENLASELIQPLANLLSARTYFGPSGRVWKLTSETWIVCGLTLGQAARIGPAHWIVSSFGLRIPVEKPSSAADFQQVAQTCSGQCCGKDVREDVGSSLLSLAPPDNLHAVRRWIEAACVASRETEIDVASVMQATIDDLAWSIRRVEYRGKQLELRHLNGWLDQIPVEFKAVAVQLVRQLAETYFVTAGEYFQALSVLIGQAAISKTQTVSFCKWQPLGRSAPHLSHDLKNQARWRVVDDVDISLPEDAWPAFKGQSPTFILVDDFVGTGRTLESLTMLGETAPIVRLANIHPQAKFVLILLVAFENPTTIAMRALRGLLGDRISVFIYRMLTDADRCFTPNSSIVPLDQQEAVKRLCVSARAKFFRALPKKFIYGYEQTGAFFAFYNSVPNNSLPVLWHDQGNWHPLLPASKTLP